MGPRRSRRGRSGRSGGRGGCRWRRHGGGNRLEDVVLLKETRRVGLVLAVMATRRKHRRETERIVRLDRRSQKEFRF